MLAHHTLECAKSSLNPESHCLVKGSFLLTERFVKGSVLCDKFVIHPCESFRSGAP